MAKKNNSYFFSFFLRGTRLRLMKYHVSHTTKPD